MNTTPFRPFQPSLTLPLSVAAISLLGAALAHAEPEVAASQSVVGVTPTRNRALGEHPAVLVARLASTRGIDSNTFIVQPPASVTWTRGPAAEPALQVAVGASAGARPAERH